MADGVFNNAKGAAAEKVRDAASNIEAVLLTANEAESALVDHLDLAALLAAGGNTEAVDASYSRKTAVTATRTQDNVNDRIDLDVPDQTWSALAGAAITKLLFTYSEGAGDANKVPLTHHDFAITPDGSDVTGQVANFYRAS